MKRAQLIKHLRAQGCELLREGASHSWWWHPGRGTRTAVPRHQEVDIPSARQFSVCRAKNLLICHVFLEPRSSKLAPVRYTMLARKICKDLGVQSCR